MCSYNMAAYVGEQLESIARQTRKPDEIVVCDDGSADATVDIVQAFAATATFPVRIVRNETRLGCNKNFEQAISLCSGDLIFLCDHDDVWRPDKIALIAALLDDDAAGAAFGDADVVGPDLTPLGFTLWDTCDFNPDRRRRFESGAQFPELMRNNVMQGAAAAFRASHRAAIMPIPSEWQHDYWIALVVSATSRIRFTERRVLDYRQHGLNLIGSGPPFRQRPQTPLRRLREQAQRWVRKARSRRRYYEERLSSIQRELLPVVVLKERLTALDPAVTGAALAEVERRLERLQARRQAVERELRR